MARTVMTNLDPPGLHQFPGPSGSLEFSSSFGHESEGQPSQYIDPRLLAHTNGLGPLDLWFKDEDFNEAMKELERRGHAQAPAQDPAATQPDDTYNGMDIHADNFADDIAGAQLPEKAIFEPNRSHKAALEPYDMVFVVTKRNEYLAVLKTTLDNCSSKFLRKAVEHIDPNAPIIYMTQDSVESATFYFAWLERLSLAREEKFLSSNPDGSPGLIPLFIMLFNLYMTGFHMDDVTFMNWIIDRWIDLLEKGFHCADMAKAIYDVKVLDLPLKKLYVHTWAMVSTKEWLDHTVDGGQAPTMFFNDVYMTKKHFKAHYLCWLKPTDLFQPWRARWAYYCHDPASNTGGAEMPSTSNDWVAAKTHKHTNGDQINNEQGKSTSAPSGPDGANSGGMRGGMSQNNWQDPSNHVSCDARKEDPRPQANDAHDEDCECAEPEAQQADQAFSKRWTSFEMMEQYGF